MTCLVDNGSTIELRPNPCSFLTATSGEGTSEKKEVSNNSIQKFKQQSILSVNLKPEQYIAFQMSFIPEHKGVFVYQSDGVYYITVAVENRDLALNRRIFERERNIMHFYRQFRFDVSIIPLANRQFTPKGTRVL
jgi:hypothetical protein